MEELRIIKRAKAGNRPAQRKLYDTYRRLWYVICLRYASDENDANDILQNALIKIYSNLGDFDMTKGAFKSWSATVVVNECLMFLRKRKGLKSRHQEYSDALVQPTQSSAISNMTVKELLAVIRALPDGYRTIFNLYAIEGFSHKEIAERLGISIGTSKSQLHKARKLLQEMVHEMFEVISQ